MKTQLRASIVLVSNNRAIMGNHVNGFGLNVMGWLATVAMFGAAAALVWTSWISSPR